MTIDKLIFILGKYRHYTERVGFLIHHKDILSDARRAQIQTWVRRMKTIEKGNATANIHLIEDFLTEHAENISYEYKKLKEKLQEKEQ